MPNQPKIFASNPLKGNLHQNSTSLSTVHLTLLQIWWPIWIIHLSSSIVWAFKPSSIFRIHPFKFIQYRGTHSITRISMLWHRIRCWSKHSIINLIRIFMLCARLLSRGSATWNLREILSFKKWLKSFKMSLSKKVHAYNHLVQLLLDWL